MDAKMPKQREKRGLTRISAVRKACLSLLFAEYGRMQKGAALAIIAAQIALGCAVETPPFDNLPLGWKVEDSFFASKEKTAEIAQRLKTPIARLSNTVLDVQGRRIQVNLVEANNETDASALYQAIAKGKDHPAYCVRKDLTVIEYVAGKTGGADLATKVSWELGYVPKPQQVRYRVTAKVAAVDEADYMRMNDLFNLFYEAEADPDAQVDAEIAAAARGFRFGNRLTLRAPSGKDSGVTAYTFSPEPVSTTSSGATTTYEFGELPQTHGIPYVAMTAEVAVTSDGVTPASSEPGDALLAATPFWPVDDPQVKALAEEITRGCKDDNEKVNALLAWFAPGKHIEYGGPVVGSRYGASKVLQQRFGRCWDFADCFVTLCRASGIPCRQVGGWMYASQGHIWAEVFLNGAGWRQVDPTGGGRVQPGIYHIAYFTTEDGHMPILYVSNPVMEVVEPQV